MQWKSGSRAVLITGGAKRVGAELVKAFVDDGWFVVIHYNNSGHEAEELATSLNVDRKTCFTIKADFLNQNDVETLLPRCNALLSEWSSKVVCLINNASSFEYDNIETLTWSGLDKHVVSGLYAPIVLSKMFYASIGEEESGLIINMLDQKVENLNPDYFSYTVSKIGLAGVTKTLAIAFKSRVRVCGVAPGILLPSGKQDMDEFWVAWRKAPLGRGAHVAEVIDAIRFIVNTPVSSGSIITIDGGESLLQRQRDVAFDA